MTRRDRLPAALLSSLLLVAACGGDAEPRVVDIVVPAGTQDRLDRGEDVVVMPSTLELSVGDTLRIRNDDDVDQAVGPYLVDAGEELSMTYGAPGRYEGVCPLSAGDRYEIVVTD